MLAGVISCFVAMFAGLSWIGWRYFASPQKTRAQADARSRSVRISVANVHAPLLLGFGLVVASVASVLALSGRISLEPLHAPELDHQQHIQAALNPEVLVPPPSLPPSVFIGTERPGLESANRDWRRLDRDFAGMVLMVFARLEARGYPFVLLEGYRSPERQDGLADSGMHVTNARAFQSKHQYGLAIDAAPMRNGRLLISEKDAWAMAAYLALGDEAERAGLTWGGRWKLKDYGHVEATGAVRARN